MAASLEFMGFDLWQWTLAIIVGWFIGMWIHELSHYIIGVIGGSKPEVNGLPKNCSVPIIPTGVTHHNLLQTSNTIIRLLGLSPLFWLPVGIITVFICMIHPSPMTLLFTFAVGIPPAIFSKDDQIALSNPTHFREMSQQGKSNNRNYWFLLLRDKLSK
jgi:hypothetical protein